MSNPQSWGEPAILIASPKCVGLHSVAAYPELSLAFSSFRVDLPAGDGPLVQSQAFVTHIPFAAKPDFPIIGFVLDLDLAGERTGATRAGVIIESMGTSKLLEFSRRDAAEVISESHRIFIAPGLAQAGGGIMGAHGQNYPDIVITVLVTAQRETVDDHIFVDIDEVRIMAIVATGIAREDD